MPEITAASHPAHIEPLNTWTGPTPTEPGDGVNKGPLHRGTVAPPPARSAQPMQAAINTPCTLAPSRGGPG